MQIESWGAQHFKAKAKKKKRRESSKKAFIISFGRTDETWDLFCYFGVKFWKKKKVIYCQLNRIM